MAIIDDCACPQSTSLTEIPVQDCSVNMKQIQRLAFQRGTNQFGTNATIPNDILQLADWQDLMIATDSTKIVVTPRIGGNPVITAGEAITNGGGDNSTLNGIEEVDGINPSVFECEFREISSETEVGIKNLMCERNLTVYFFLQGGKIGVLKIDDTNYKGFKAESLVLLDRNNTGLNTKDMHKMSFSLLAGWSEKLVILTPNFNPTLDL